MSEIPLEKIKELAAFCRENGITHVKADGIELSFEPPKPRGTSLDEMKRIQEALASDELGPEEALFMSAPQYVSPEQAREALQAMKGG